jgi:lysophospholipase L1-like esterase
MFRQIAKKGRAAASILGMLTAAALLLSASAAPAGADEGGGYLALGDSVPFGFITQAGFEYGNPVNFVGYPSYVGEALDLKTVNASCPGQTTSSFISLGPSVPDNGCNAYRASAPLHVAYSGSQLGFAASYLNAHHNTRLVSIMLGANDAFLLQKACANNPQCIQAGLPQLLATISTNLNTILHGLRGAHFHGLLVVVNYYSLDYGDAAGTGLTSLLNQAIDSTAHADGAVVADAFSAFQAAASTTFAGGHTCKAGLLNALPQNQFLCDVHPSQSGAMLLASTVERAFEASDH